MKVLTGEKQSTPLHLSHELKAIQRQIKRNAFRFFINFGFKSTFIIIDVDKEIMVAYNSFIEC
jgi:hypothetical protein